jgi:hypothetical protein
LRTGDFWTFRLDEEPSDESDLLGGFLTSKESPLLMEIVGESVCLVWSAMGLSLEVAGEAGLVRPPLGLSSLVWLVAGVGEPPVVVSDILPRTGLALALLLEE